MTNEELIVLLTAALVLLTFVLVWQGRTKGAWKMGRVKLKIKWPDVVRFSGGVTGTVTQVPIGDVVIVNVGRVPAKNVEARFSTSPLDPHWRVDEIPVGDREWSTGVPMVPSEYPNVFGNIQVQALEFPWEVTTVTATVTWETRRGKRSKPLVSESHDYGNPKDPDDYDVLKSFY